MNETIDALTEDAKKHLKEAGRYQAKADKATLAAGVALRELKARITKKESAEGKEWGHSWPKFVQAKLKGECSYSHAQRLIAFAESKNPVAAIAEYRKQDAAQKRDRRASQTSGNRAQMPTDAAKEQLTSPGAAQERAKPEPTMQIPAREEDERRSAQEALRRAKDGWKHFPARPDLFMQCDAMAQANFLQFLWVLTSLEGRELFCKWSKLQRMPAARRKTIATRTAREAGNLHAGETQA